MMRMAFSWQKAAWVGLFALAASGSQAGGMESLDAFVKNVKSGRASFTQTVSAPAKDGPVVRAKV
jgi:outer membrane lipoprotein carrier protein